MTAFESAAAVIFLLLGVCVIVFFIAISFKIAADARIEEAEQSVNRRADRLARQMMHDRLDGLQIVVTQRISVIEDDLKGGKI